MNTIATLGVNRDGRVISAIVPSSSHLNELLPTVGGNITMHFDKFANDKMKGMLNAIFKTIVTNQFTLIINSHLLQCTAHHYLEDIPFLYFKLIEQKSYENLQDIVDKKNEASRLKLLDFPFQDSNIPILYVYKDGSLYDFNDAFCHLFGYEVEDAKTFNLSNWNQAYYPDTWEQTWEKLKTQGVISFISKRSKKDGTVIDVEIRAHYIKFGDLELNCASITDITELKKEEVKLKLADFSFQNVFSPITFIKEDGSFFYYNEATANLFGYSMEEFEHLTIFDILTTFNHEQWQKRWDNVTQNVRLTLNTRLQKKDGSWIDAEIRTNRISFGDVDLNCSFYTDNSEKKKLEMKLEMVEFSFRNSETAIVYLQENGQLVDFNEAYIQLLGYSKEEAANLSIFELNLDFDGEFWKENWLTLREKRIITFFTKRKKKDGSIIDLELRVNMMTHDVTEVCCAYITDVTERKRIDNKLRLVDFAFENASTAILFVKQDASIYDMNESAHHQLGYTKEEMMGMTIFDLDNHFDLETWAVHWRELQTIEFDSIVSQHKKKDGTQMDVELRVKLIEYNGLQLSCAFVTDITEKKRNDERLNVVNFTFQNASIANLLIKSDGSFFDFNLASLDLFGYTRDEMQKLRIIDLAPTATKEVRKEIWDGIRKSGTLVHYKSMKRKDGILMDIELRSNRIVKGDIELNCAFLIDITEKKKQEERLKLLERVVTETNQSILIADATEGMDTPIIYANNAFKNISGYELEEVKGQNPRLLHRDMEVGDDEGRTNMRNAIKNCIPWRVEVINTKKNGEHYWADIAGFPVYDMTLGKYSHWVAIKSDITKRKESEFEREQMLKELIEINKELKQFSYITTHNLRAPLTNLLSICKLLDTDNITDNRTLKLIEGFKSSTNHLNDTLNDLISILIIKENINITKDHLNFQEKLDKVKSFLSIQLSEEQVVIEADFEEMPTVKFTNVYLESIFLNLLTNAIRFKHPERSPIVKIKTSKNRDGKTQLTFADNGIGMNMKLEMIKDRIFGLYQRFHNNTEGKGIGLYLLYSQITALGGKIEVDSEEGVGTTFTITFS